MLCQAPQQCRDIGVATVGKPRGELGERDAIMCIDRILQVAQCPPRVSGLRAGGQCQRIMQRVAGQRANQYRPIKTRFRFGSAFPA